MQITCDPWISEWGNLTGKTPVILTPIHNVRKGTRGTETSKYPEEKKINNDSVSSGERKRKSPNQFSNCGEKGNLIASGFIAGGALMGVVSALLRFGGIDFAYDAWWANPLSEILSLGAYALLIVYFIRATRK